MKSTTVEPARKSAGGVATLAPPEAQTSSATAPEPELDEESGFDWDVMSLLRPFGDAPAWVISLSIHLVFLMVLSTFVVEHSPLRDYIAIDSTIDSVKPDPTFDAVVTEAMGTQSDLHTMASSQEMATAHGDNPQTEIRQVVDEMVLPRDIPLIEDVPDPPQTEVLVTSVNVRGARTENTGGVEGAIDRLTFEIANSLRERKTLVVWLFDASLSLKDRRDNIADRFENVYKQLNALEVGADRSLKTCIATYGQKTTILTPEPVDDVRQVQTVVRNIKNDESGKEFVFAAVNEVAHRWNSYRLNSKRNMMIIIVTDERGDDAAQMEPVIDFVRKNGIRTYVVGNAAPFGREEGYVRWRFDDNTTEDIKIDAGPETVRPEAIKLAFWGSNSHDLDRMSSGYGPYAMTRLTAESGGMYLIAAEDEGGKRFSHEIMRNYAPDYRPIKFYDDALRKNMAKAALVECATQTSIQQAPIPPLYFRAENDTILRQQITEAQRPIADLEYHLNKMLEILAKGEKDREKVTEARWQAAYDVSIGRVLAMQARAFGYNTMLAEMKATPKVFQTKGNNQWYLAPSKDISAGPAVKKLSLRASTYLKRVVDDHPGTPWAMLAEKELSQPMGWEWKEGKVDIPRMARDETDPKKKAMLLLAEEEQKKKAMERQRREQRAKPML